MSGDLYLGVQPTGGDLYLQSAGAAVASFSGASVVGFSARSAAVFVGASAFVAAGIALVHVEGEFEGSSTLAWRGLATRGDAVFTQGSVFVVDNTLLSSAIAGSSTLGFAGRGVTRFVPDSVIPGYTVIGGSIVIPLASLIDVTAAEAHAANGSWPELFQSLLRVLDAHLAGLSPIASTRPRTVRSFMLEDWKRYNRTFGRHMKRSFTLEFITTNPPTNLFE